MDSEGNIVKRSVTSIVDAPAPHWVGDGFPVRSLFSYDRLGEHTSPFLLLDHAGPRRFEPTTQRRGVGSHPHRGFETVTIVYEGEVAHRDSTGQGGVIGPGDVQWMTAGAGILHDEFHSEAFAQRGGALEMVQLWVNLPARDKMTAPGYQAITAAQIPSVPLPGDAGHVRVIAGTFGAQQGPARTFSPLDVWDLRLHAAGRADLSLPSGRTVLVVVLHGAVRVNGEAVVQASQMAVLARDGETFTLEAEAGHEGTTLVLSGEPIDEPIVGYGPFVMNSEAQIRQAVADFNAGRFGAIAATQEARA